MEPVLEKLLLAYVNACSTITRKDAKLHRHFFLFKIILEDEMSWRMDCQFVLAAGKAFKSQEGVYPYCESLESLVDALVEEGKLAADDSGQIDITPEGYQRLIDLRKSVDAQAPQVRYLISRTEDPRYLEKSRQLVRKMEETGQAY